MCGRYYVDDETVREIERRTGVSVSQLWKELRGERRDIYPSQSAVVLRAEKDHLGAEKMRWGFLSGQRAEQAMRDPGKRIL